MDVTNKPINLTQLQGELVTAKVVTTGGLGLTGPSETDPAVDLHTFDADGVATDLPPEAVPVVNAHVAMRDKTDEEYAAEFQDPSTTVVRKQEIRDITAGLMPREQVPM